MFPCTAEKFEISEPSTFSGSQLVSTADSDAFPWREGLNLMRDGHFESADSVLTGFLSQGYSSSDLWMAAGMARLCRGAMAGAHSAFMMCAWLSDDPVARKLAAAVKEQEQLACQRAVVGAGIP